MGSLDPMIWITRLSIKPLEDLLRRNGLNTPNANRREIKFAKNQAPMRFRQQAVEQRQLIPRFLN